MNNAEFEEHVQFAVKTLEKLMIHREGFKIVDNDAFEQWAVDIAFKRCDLSNQNEILMPTLDGFTLSPSEPLISSWLNQAQLDPRLFDALLGLIASHLERGDSLHPLVTTWLVQYLRGEIKRPKYPKGRPSTAMRDAIICQTIIRVCERGLKPTKADFSNAICAIDVVLAACKQLGLAKAQYDHFKDIWEKYKKRTQLNQSIE